MRKVAPLIFLVDDDTATREAIGELLAANDFSVRKFASAEELLNSPRLPKAACLVLDVQMPKVSGIELHAQLVQRGYCIPTLFMTAFPRQSVRHYALTAGVGGYLIKPFTARRLLTRLRALLKQES